MSLHENESPAPDNLPSVEGPDAPEFPAPAPPEYPEDLRAPWGWLDLLLLALFAVGAIFVLGSTLAAAFSVFGVPLAQLRQSTSDLSLFNIVLTVLLYFALLGYLAAQIHWGFHAPFWRTIGWRALEPGVLRRVQVFSCCAGGIGLAMATQFASGLIPTKAKMPIEEFLANRLSATLLMLIAVLVAPLVEETIFRGYIYPVVARRFGVGAAVGAVGTLFGMFHAMQLGGVWGQVALLIVVGLVLTYVRATTRTVLASYLVHVSYNATVSFGFLVATHGLKVLPGAH